ncbi:MAG: FkbM family methyltransferase, partial [Alphaproteobacteria bacterium]
MVGTLRRFIRRAGFDVAPFPGTALHWTRIIALLDRYDIDCLFDIGANTGQYARAVRANGYKGRIVSFEPLTDVQQALRDRAVRDPLWTVAPQTAIGARTGTIEINVSGESDMSSILPLDKT